MDSNISAYFKSLIDNEDYKLLVNLLNHLERHFLRKSVNFLLKTAFETRNATLMDLVLNYEVVEISRDTDLQETFCFLFCNQKYPVIKKLLQKVDSENRKCYLRYLLFSAAEFGQEELLDIVLHFNEIDIHAVKTDFFACNAAPIHFAAFHGHVSIVKKLLAVKWDLDILRKSAQINQGYEDDWSGTPLELATFRGYFDVEDFLTQVLETYLSKRSLLDASRVQIFQQLVPELKNQHNLSDVFSQLQNRIQRMQIPETLKKSLLEESLLFDIHQISSFVPKEFL